MLKRHPFILPSVPILKRAPPTGSDWLHEVKFDGWRAQLHKDGDAVAIYSRNGRDMTKRFPHVRDSLIALPAHTAIIDAEIVVCDGDGRPDFLALMRGKTDNLCAWCFDLIDLNDRDLRSKPLIERKALLGELLIEADDDVLRYSSEWSDPHAHPRTQLFETAANVPSVDQSLRRPMLAWLRLPCTARPLGKLSIGIVMAIPAFRPVQGLLHAKP